MQRLSFQTDIRGPAKGRSEPKGFESPKSSELQGMNLVFDPLIAEDRYKFIADILMYSINGFCSH